LFLSRVHTAILHGMTDQWCGGVWEEPCRRGIFHVPNLSVLALSTSRKD